MKNIVLKVPTAIFIALVFLPLMIVVLQMISGQELVELKYLSILALIGSIVTSIWLFSIVDYFHSKAPDFKYTRLINILLIFELVVNLLESLNIQSFEGIIDFSLMILQTAIFITAVVLIVLLVRKVFYERSVWFIVIEILFTIIGITTLSPEIKRNEKELLAQDID